MSRKTTIDSLFTQRGDPAAAKAPASPERVRTGAISAMGASLKELTESAKAASRLADQIASGAVVVEIEPERVDASMVVDRIAADVDPGFEALVESVRTAGQQAPILVRPAGEGRYQVAYGHHRLRAAARLGIKVKALVRELTDVELVIAQAKENLDRKDLSYIEKAQFARRLEDQGFDRAVVMSALAIDKADLSRYLSVARAVPERIVRAIGPAPKAGRPRWVALAEKLKSAPKKADAVIASDAFQRLDSDARFAAVFDAFTRPARKASEYACGKAARIERRQGATVLTLDEKRAPEFGAFLVERLEALYRDYRKEKEDSGKL